MLDGSVLILYYSSEVALDGSALLFKRHYHHAKAQEKHKN